MTNYTQIPANSNELNTTNFKLYFPNIPNVVYWCQEVNHPSINMGTSILPSPVKAIPIPGDKVEFEDLTISFLVDEDLKNYIELYNWIGKMCPISSLSDVVNSSVNSITEIQNTTSIRRVQASLHILTNNKNYNLTIRYHNCFIYNLGEINFTTKDFLKVPITASFKITHFTFN